MEEDIIQKAIDPFWGCNVKHFEWDMKGHKLRFELSYQDGEAHKEDIIIFEGVDGFCYLENKYSDELNEWECIEISELYHNSINLDEVSVNIYHTASNSTHKNISFKSNFLIDIWGHYLSIRAHSIDINGQKIEVNGLPSYALKKTFFGRKGQEK